jgi:phenylpropionate dioxygenase-like ring-hydroxylating dioxygenase large terminal subunit
MTSSRDMGLDNGRFPVKYYTSPEIFDREKDQIFRRVWLMVGREDEIGQPGDYIVREIVTLGSSVVIVRGKDGVVRAFHNSCSHRGVALVCEEKGSASTFRCPYHAWVYGIDGMLRAVPSENDFPHVDKAKNGLTPVALDIWNGFIFLNFAERPEVPLREFLSGLDVLLDGMPFQDYPFHIKVVDEIDCNWKNLVNAFNEGYHVAILHKKTLYQQVIPRENPFLHYLDIRSFGPHSAGTVQRNFEWSPSTPVLSWVLTQMLPTSVPDKEAVAAGKTGLTSHAGINRIKIPNFGTETITIFPNISIQPLANGYLFYQFWPLSHDRMRTEVRVYGRHAPQNLREEFAAANTLAATRDVVSEDMAMSRLQQIGLKGGGKKFQNFGENEPILRLFAQYYEAYLAGDCRPPKAEAAQ